MFTGIITDIGTVRAAEQRGDLRLTIATSYDPATIDLGASIACSGVCLTVVDKGSDWFAVDVSHESVSRTALALWTEGARLNLERALRMGDELGGHLVTGHVDGIGEVMSATPDGGSLRISIRAPRDLGRFIAAKGSITLDGVSLTVNDVIDSATDTDFTINLIPHTADHTTLGEVAVGQSVNLEIDVLARYLKRLEESRN
ncbi:riboflavin synthase [Sphingomonas sp.]|uniref:riboflavin synthase n=1 Tax=Sphingomonas sp. TaxID=28214 RepID=UPI00286C4DB0|nr:riboflavin synthase [Sphingomonas sp.]